MSTAEKVLTMYELKLENRRLRKALRKYGDHIGICMERKFDDENSECTCDFVKALKIGAVGGKG